jgi:hypothetical protein
VQPCAASVALKKSECPDIGWFEYFGVDLVKKFIAAHHDTIHDDEIINQIKIGL